MFNLIGKLKFYDGRLCSFSSASKLFLLQLNQLSSSIANAPNPDAENNLKNRFTFSPEREFKHSNHRKHECNEGPDSVIAFLKKHGCNDSRISVIVRSWPSILQHVPETSFVPKINYFRSLGFSSKDIVMILTLAPRLLGSSLEDQIMPCVKFLKSFIRSERDFLVAIRRSPRILEANVQDTLLPIVGILREVGVPDRHIGALLKIKTCTVATDPESFRSTVQQVQKLDIKPQTKAFIVAITVVREQSISNWKEKIDLYKSWGWSTDQLMDAFKKNPRMMAISKEKISNIHDLLINKMGCDLSFVVTSPNLFICGVEKVIAPRCAYHQVLLSKGLIKQGYSLSGDMLTCSKWVFYGRYVRFYAKENPELLNLYDELFR